MTAPHALRDVVAYFDHKTSAILERYGPGPRVHYHTGLVDAAPATGASIGALRRALVDGQEVMLREAARIWDAPRRLAGEVLDVGCGLGGGSIFWAQEFGAEVTALTCVPAHAEWVTRFARQAGVEAQVRPIVCDACEAPGKARFDAVVAVDSSGYLPREAWFARVAELIRPGGSVFVIDCFLEEPRYAELFDRHWLTRVGALDEYYAAARASGLEIADVTDVTERTVHFWTTTLALIDLEAQAADGRERRLAASRRAHEWVRNGLASGGFRYAMLTFDKKAGKVSRLSGRDGKRLGATLAPAFDGAAPGDP